MSSGSESDGSSKARKRRKKAYDPAAAQLFTLAPPDKQLGAPTGFEDDERLQAVLPFGKRPGRMYVAMDDETPLSIAKDLGLNVRTLVKINLKMYPGLQSKSKLIAQTRLKLPPSPRQGSRR